MLYPNNLKNQEFSDAEELKFDSEKSSPLLDRGADSSSYLGINTLEFINPFENQTIAKMPDPCVLVIFGVTGDLAIKRLIPALYTLSLSGQLPSHFACVGFARREKTTEQFRQELFDSIDSKEKPIQEDVWDTFSEHLFYHRSEFDNDEGYSTLAEFLKTLDVRFGTRGNRIYYLSTPPSHFPVIVKKLHQHKLIYPNNLKNREFSDAERHRFDFEKSSSLCDIGADFSKSKMGCSVKKKTDSSGYLGIYNTFSKRFSRIIIEKPFGHDLQSALSLENELEKYLHEDQMFRIDHYLGKETVQNLLVFRFANSIFEPLWNNKYIDHIQITVSEESGIGTRGKLYEEAGTLRDMVQNHMMQLFSLVAMEPPVDTSANAIRDEKVKVLSLVRALTKEEVGTSVVKGQYGPGFIRGEPVKGYRQEDNVSESSEIDTYIALKLFIDNWRWDGVPFFLRTGKRLPKRATEIAIFFKATPKLLFSSSVQNEPNTLIIRIQPDEGISLKLNSKVPGGSNIVHPVKMDFRYSTHFGISPPDAYERLICDCMLGDQTLFTRQDEAIASWKLLQPILDYWKDSPPPVFPNYSAGSWGPQAATDLINQESHRNFRLI